ncbi:Mitochondrial chaperone [Colletotrichum fructicola]|uniref:Mitochondrial chaperone BCS1 n=2 Tax=Colletotrichum gloeosporioides species complex TaxID=2707338 RepID=A0A7J6IPJ3_COLFN|nr:Mitochondrial chaperone [Colletotrichum fructicola]KAF4477636.1 Mitochondrial chaperone BCS1 [Colletotrichum fructicola Nara gc5]KAE9575218.1 Mitochondrial chaperone [Colletotrichum fructicola]KAF4428449.1 Mitochondrial chaperone BCS1 [Colletotrichum fructicola]KAF4893075.1 Mitochondrial chaperone BCS1 [Colletotrichum fructicola]KAF5493028.1 Mitochondrial chaperone BCS1 [Colletotrichum fructicola]
MASPDPATTTSTATASAAPSILNLDALFNNPLFAGGIGLASLGAAAAFARKGALVAAGAARRRLLVNVEISKQDPAYPWILAWLSQPREAAGFVASRITRIHNLSVSTTTSNARGAAASGPANAHFFLQPGYGRHIVKHGNAYIAVNREKHSTANMNTGEPHEIVQLTALWAHRHVFEEVFGEAHALAAKANEGKTVVYAARGMEWAPLGDPRKKRPLGSVILDEGVKEGIVDDVRDFLTRQQWYVDRGIPYRRGYLLFGPPGSGKSSFIQSLAGELDFSVAMINLSEMGMTDDKLAYLLTKLPRRSLLLLEDADAAFVNRRQRDADGYSGASVTFSGLLNALDGVAAGEERIAFLTTNHIERLDPALIRPGRVDMMMRIGEATRYQAGQMWDRFYGDVDADGSGRERFLNRLDELHLFGNGEGETAGRFTSTAAIQGLFLFNKNDMQGAIDMAEGLIPRKFEAGDAIPEGAIKTKA